MRLLPRILQSAAFLCLFVAPALSADLYWRTDGTAGQSWTGASWSNPASPTGGTGWTSGSNAFFTESSSLSFATTAVGNVTVSAGKSVTIAANNLTLTLGGVRTFDIGTGATLNWASQKQSTAPINEGAGVTKTGEGTLNWGAGPGENSRFNGGFTLNQGTVIVTGDYAFGSGVLTINGGTIESSGKLDFTSTSLVVGGNFELTKTGSSTATATWSMPVDLSGGVRTITQNATGADRIFGGVISNGGLTKAGSGVLTLSGANTFTGPTTVNTGTLKLTGSGSIATSSVVTVGSGATLDVSGVTGGWSVASGQKLAGAGTVTGAVTVNGTHAPSGSHAVTGSLAYGTGSIFEWDLTSANTNSGFDTVSVTGSLGNALGAFKVMTDLDFGTSFWNSQKDWNSIFSVSGASVGWLANTAVSVYSSAGTLRNVGDQGSFAVTGTTLTWTPVPEPSSALAGLLLGAGLMRRRRNSEAGSRRPETGGGG